MDRFPKDARVGILASGGLSHFTVDEELDREFLAACKTQRRRMAVGGAGREAQFGQLRDAQLDHHGGRRGKLSTLAWSQYVPCYRSLAGTGCGMGFAVWQ